ncbi:uncharacterized protein [Hyperolius riggenbachi]|uniref:uncharacterized protein n=1 Tax=Hyperolius riggenbachi TaxID=752182 RepID=UPI0035A27EA2
MELSAELKGRDGGSCPFRVSCEKSLPGLLAGLERLQGEVSAELSRLVERERGGAGDTGGDALGEEEAEEDDDDDDDDGDEEDSKKNGTLASTPPAKRKKV